MKDRPASLPVDICPFLLKTKNDLIVIDPGLGFKLDNGEFHIHQNILRYGFHPDEVTKVLLSHLHKDHIGGAAFQTENKFELMFPHARYYVQQGEIDFAFERKGKSFEMDKLEFLVKHKNMTTISGNGKITDEIEFEITGGHTPFHQSFLISIEKEKFFYGGDVLPQSSQLIRKFVAKYDYDGKLAAEKRIEFGNRAANGNWICLYFHSTSTPMSRVKKDVDGKFLIEKI